MSVQLETPRLVLRTPTGPEVEGYYHAIVGTDIFDTLIWDGPAGLADLQAYWLAPQPTDPRAELNFAVIEQASGAMMGGVSLRPRRVNTFLCDIGYALAKPWHGRGYGTEAIAELCRHAMEDREFERIEAKVFTGNTASARVLEKCGFVLEGTHRRVDLKQGQWKDNWLYGLIKPDWLARKR